MIETIRMLGFGFCGTYGAMYRRQPAVRTVVDFLARNVAQLNAKVYERVSNTDRVELYDHPAATLLRHPNPVTTRYRHMFATVADMAIYDRAYWRILRQQGRLAVVRVSPEILHANDETRPDGTVRRVYRLTDGTEVPRSQLIIFPGYAPDNFDEGVSPLETLRRVLEEEAAAIAHRNGMWRNAARQSGWIERPAEAPEWSDAARRRFREEIEAMMSGAANSGRIGVLEDGMRWNGNSFSPVDTEYIAGRRLTYEETAVVYGIDPSLFGLGSATKASTEQKHTEVYQDVFGPLLREIQDELDLQLLPLMEPGSSAGDDVFRVQHRRQAERVVRDAGDGVDDVGRCAGDDTERRQDPVEPAPHRRRPVRHADHAVERHLRRAAGGDRPHRDTWNPVAAGVAVTDRTRRRVGSGRRP